MVSEEKQGFGGENDPTKGEGVLKDSVMVKSSIMTTNVDSITIEGEKRYLCPTCQNILSENNRRLLCEKCGRNDFCETCEEFYTDTDTYNCYKLEFAWPLCKYCYALELEKQQKEIDEGRTGSYERLVRPVSGSGSLGVLEGSPLGDAEFKPLLHEKNPEVRARRCANVGMLLGFISIFVLGFLFGTTALFLGYAAKVRGNTRGNYAMIMGALGLASSIFWMLFTGGGAWYL